MIMNEEKKKNTKGYCIVLNKDVDMDIIEYLAERKVKKTFCKLIRKQIREEQEHNK